MNTKILYYDIKIILDNTTLDTYDKILYKDFELNKEYIKKLPTIFRKNNIVREFDNPELIYYDYIEYHIMKPFDNAFSIKQKNIKIIL